MKLPRGHREEYHPEDDSRYIAEKIFNSRRLTARVRIDLDAFAHQANVATTLGELIEIANRITSSVFFLRPDIKRLAELIYLLRKINEGYYLDPTTRPGPKNGKH